MRKADYAALAAIIAEQLRNARLIDTLESRAMRETAESIASRFAARASVNRAEFLKACGLTP